MSVSEQSIRGTTASATATASDGVSTVEISINAAAPPEVARQALRVLAAGVRTAAAGLEPAAVQALTDGEDVDRRLAQHTALACRLMFAVAVAVEGMTDPANES